MKNILLAIFVYLLLNVSVSAETGKLILKSPYPITAKITDQSRKHLEYITNKTSAHLALGTYVIDIEKKVTIKQTIQQGATTININSYGGWIGINSPQIIGGLLYNNQGKYLTLINSLKPPQFFLPGRYKLKIESDTRNIDLKAGQVEIINLSNQTHLSKKIYNLYKAKKYREAIPLAKRHAEEIRKKSGTKSQPYSNALFNIGVLYFYLHMPKQSNTYFRQALQVIGRTGPVPPKVLPRLLH